MFKRSGEIVGFYFILAGKVFLVINYKEFLFVGGKWIIICEEIFFFYLLKK